MRQIWTLFMLTGMLYVFLQAEDDAVKPDSGQSDASEDVYTFRILGLVDNGKLIK